jgi:hypothetical protein
VFYKVYGIRIIIGGDVSSLAVCALRGWLKRDVVEEVKTFLLLSSSSSATAL